MTMTTTSSNFLFTEVTTTAGKVILQHCYQKQNNINQRKFVSVINVLSYKLESYVGLFDQLFLESDPTKKSKVYELPSQIDVSYLIATCPIHFFSKNLDHRNIIPEKILKFATSIVQRSNIITKWAELAGKVDNRGTRTVKREIKRRACQLSLKISKPVRNNII